MLEFIILGIVGVVTVGSVIIAKMYLKPDEYSGKLKRNMERYVAELEEDNKVLVKQMNAMKKGARISEEDLNDPLQAIGALLPQFEHLVPAKFKPFLRDPKAMEFIAGIIKEHPEEAKKLLQNFVSKKGRNDALAQPDSEASEMQV